MTEKKRPTRIRRAEHNDDNPWFMMHRDTAQDKNLSWEARGILAYILSKPDDWIVQVKDLQQAKCGRDKVYRILDELKDAGYIRRERKQDDKGRITWGDYLISERPFPENTEMDTSPVDSPFPENPDTEKPYTENQELTNNRTIQRTETTTSRPPLLDPFYDAIATVWKTRASGLINSMKAMMRGTSRSGEWANANFIPPANPEEILAFGKWWKLKHPDLTLPTKPEKIQRWFYEFRDITAKKITPVDPTMDLSKPVDFDPPLTAYLKAVGNE